MNMVEKVARAMALVIVKRYSDKNKDSSPNIEYWLNEARYDEARAAIEAMREPTEEMIELFRYTASDEYILRCWSSSIDAALK